MSKYKKKLYRYILKRSELEKKFLKFFKKDVLNYFKKFDVSFYLHYTSTSTNVMLGFLLPESSTEDYEEALFKYKESYYFISAIVELDELKISEKNWRKIK